LTATTSARLIGLTLALLLTGPALAAVKDRVPLPHLRPHQSADGQVATPQAPGAPAARQPTAAAPAKPLTQQQILASITDYFNSFRTMEGNFVQVGPNGERSEGAFFLAKPGRIRFHYRPPTRLDVIADGQSVAVRDNKEMTQDLYPLSKTPLRYLLAERIDLTSAQIVREVHLDHDAVSIVIVEPSVEGRLTMIFDRRTYELKQWVVTDAQGLNTTVAVYNVATGKPEDPGLFRIDVSATGK
jgi:outer membrane lipoprotein-sorting protein